MHPLPSFEYKAGFGATFGQLLITASLNRQPDVALSNYKKEERNEI